jgi:hypothetical protein
MDLVGFGIPSSSERTKPVHIPGVSGEYEGHVVGKGKRLTRRERKESNRMKK